MEGIISQKVTPLLKCMVLFLLIFTAKVLTSRPHDIQGSRNSIYQPKPVHYVRTFTKYHHRRTNQWNTSPDLNSYWPVVKDHAKKVKRSIPNSNNQYISPDMAVMNQFAPESIRENTGSLERTAISSSNDFSNKNGVTSGEKKIKVKPALIYKEPVTTHKPGISCLYKMKSVAFSVTPSYDDDANAQLTVETDHFETPGVITKTTLHNGEESEVEQCTDPQACYILWQQNSSGNITILGQGCWRSARQGCDKCTQVTPRLPGTKFCCCTSSYCNADFLSIQEEVVTPKAVVTAPHHQINYSNIFAATVLAIIAFVAIGVAFNRIYCKRRRERDDESDGLHPEKGKGDVMGSGPEALATGLSCVDNLTLTEHIGQGKFGSVWRGSLGSKAVAVKLYSNANAWQREMAIYAMPHLAHPNILRYYGGDSRPSLTGAAARSHLIVLELCACTLRRRLQLAPLTWQQFAALAHGLASATAHLHTATPTKPCIVHRDINSNNVLISADGTARLADLGLAQVLHAREQCAPGRVAEAGTLRYLSPEALEGALDLSGARAALCAVDVFALGLVLWELLWRTRGAHRGPPPPYAPPYAPPHAPPHEPPPTLAHMQNLVSRNKVRPPLPKGPVSEARALKIASDTCAECWDHDAEARLTAVCVEERMAELKQMLRASGPVIHDNNLHPHEPGCPPGPDTDKNSNCVVSQTCDVTTPLLYTQPHIGRNPCLERNTHTSQAHTVELIHKSLKDIAVPNSDAPRTDNEEHCLSVARINHSRINENSDRLNEIRSYPRPLDYVPNDVSVTDRGLKEMNLLQDVRVERPKWGIRKFFEKKSKIQKALETEVKLVPDLGNGAVQANTKISIVNDKPSNVPFRPSNLVLNQDGRNLYNLEGPCLSPPNRTLSPTMMLESEINRSENKVFGFKEMPARNDEEKPNQIFAVIVPKAQPVEYQDAANLELIKTRGSSESLKHSVRTSMSSHSIFKSAGHSESEDSTIKKRLSCDNKIISNASNSGRSSRASINLELQYIDNSGRVYNENDSPFELNSECSSSEDEHLMLLSENGGSKITMQTVPKISELAKQSEVLKESSQSKPDFCFNKFHNKYASFDNEFSDPADKENLVTYSGDNPVYLAALNGEIDTKDLKFATAIPESSEAKAPNSPKPSLRNLTIKRQHSLEHVSEIFSSAGDIHLQNPAGRVKTPGDLPVAVRKARRDRALQKGRAHDSNRLSLYDDRMMFGNSL